MFEGTYTALVTPFRDGLVDTEAFIELIEAQLAAGVEGIVPVGTTGESPTLTHDEHLRVIELAVQAAQGKTQVIAGTGSNSTIEAVEMTQAAEQFGADAALLVCPYYNKPTQAGLYEHFMAVAQSTKLPIILYSIPGRCVIEIHEDTVARLARDASNIVAIKEAGGDVSRVSRLGQVLPDDFTILSGDDGLTLPFMSVGGKGVISVASNIIPTEVKALVDAAAAGDYARAEAMHRKYYDAFTGFFIESNPAPIKAALAELGKMSSEVRLPLVPISEGSKATLFAILKKCGILEN